tara:strand:+ start:1563 stop:2537 length:975 start_codon:yes stop_codon:yes gene_type:complete
MFGYRTIGFGGKASRGGGGPGDRGLYGGGEGGLMIDYIAISTTGNGTDFGDGLRYQTAGGVCNGGSGDRGLFSGGSDPWPGPYSFNTIAAVTVSTLGDAEDTGDLTEGRRFMAGVSNGSEDRGVYMGGYIPGGVYARDTIDYVTISTAGDAIDFGDLLVGHFSMTGVSNASDRGVACGGRTQAVNGVNTLQYITISTTGDATDFGDTSVDNIQTNGGCSNDTGDRGIYGGGEATLSTVYVNIIEYITISTASDGTDFGDLLEARYNLSSCSNGAADRGTFAGGAPGNIDTIDYVTISSEGDAADFGNLTSGRTMQNTGLSNGQT